MDINIPIPYARKKISEKMKDRFVGEKTKKKLSLIKKGKNNPRARAVIINNKYFDTVKEASEFIGVFSKTITRRVLHKTKWSGYKYAK